MSHATFNILYDGPALEGSEMAVRDLSAALLSTDALFAEADRVINSGRTDSRLKVQGSFKSGCFGIDFISGIHLADKFKDLFSGDAASAICNAQTIFNLLFGATGLFGLLKWLRRRKPTRIEQRDGKCIIFVADEYFETEVRVIELFNAYKVREAMEKVTDPIRTEGVNDFSVIQGEVVVAAATKQEAEYFIASGAPTEQLDDNTRETWLNIVSPAFKDGDKWRVNDGGSNFFASVMDPDFLLKVLKNEVEFGAATRLRVTLREVQYTDHKGMLHKDYDILKVIEVKKPDTQLMLNVIEEPEQDGSGQPPTRS
jgi:hypothetical protein